MLILQLLLLLLLLCLLLTLLHPPSLASSVAEATREKPSNRHVTRTPIPMGWNQPSLTLALFSSNYELAGGTAASSKRQRQYRPKPQRVSNGTNRERGSI